MTNPRKKTTQMRRAQTMVGRNKVRMVVGLLIPAMLLTVSGTLPAQAATKTLSLIHI
jgi:hypothetical protein